MKVKNRGGLVLPSLEIEKVVNIADSLYSAINTEQLFKQKNIVQKMQIETCRVVAEAHPHILEALDGHMGTLGSHKKRPHKKNCRLLCKHEGEEEH